MKKLIISCVVIAALLGSAPCAFAGPKDDKSSQKEDPAKAAEREAFRKKTNEILKWVLAAGTVGLIGFALWRFFAESSDAARLADRDRQPWERPPLKVD
jgi:hypothetical protein